MKPGRHIAPLARAIYLGSAFALLFFLAASAPHRVHHFFETALPRPAQVAHHHDDHAHAPTHEHNHERKPAPLPAQTDCVVLAAAQQSHAATVESFEVALAEISVDQQPAHAIVSISLHNPSPRSQRAPPLA